MIVEAERRQPIRQEVGYSIQLEEEKSCHNVIRRPPSSQRDILELVRKADNLDCVVYRDGDDNDANGVRYVVRYELVLKPRGEPNGRKVRVRTTFFL